MSAQAVRVYCRVRPFNEREKGLGNLVKALRVTDTDIEIESRQKVYNFDQNFDDSSTQLQVFNVIGHAVVDDFLDGFNATQFVYGQTGAGKSWTMMGIRNNPQLSGIIPRSCALLFQRIQEKPEGWTFSIEASYLEIYMERVNDLLDAAKENLDVKESKDKGVFIPGLTKECVTSLDDIFDILDRGDSIRKVAATNMNAGSSRSHSVFSIYLEQTNPSGGKIFSQLNLVDLAGSERIDKTGATGEVLKQGTLINLSLTVLSQVIAGLSKIAGGATASSVAVPYRESKLTRLLQTSLGGDAKTGLSIHCSPHADNLDESISTLEFGKRAKQIKNNAKARVKKSADQLERELDSLKRAFEELSETFTRLGGADLLQRVIRGEAVTIARAELAKQQEVEQEREMTRRQSVVDLDDNKMRLSSLVNQTDGRRGENDKLKTKIARLVEKLEARESETKEIKKDMDVKELEVLALQSKIRDRRRAKQLAENRKLELEKSQQQALQAKLEAERAHEEALEQARKAKEQARRIQEEAIRQQQLALKAEEEARRQREEEERINEERARKQYEEELARIHAQQAEKEKENEMKLLEARRIEEENQRLAREAARRQEAEIKRKQREEALMLAREEAIKQAKEQRAAALRAAKQARHEAIVRAKAAREEALAIAKKNREEALIQAQDEAIKNHLQEVTELTNLIQLQKSMITQAYHENQAIMEDTKEISEQLADKTRRLALAEIKVMRYDMARSILGAPKEDPADDSAVEGAAGPKEPDSARPPMLGQKPKGITSAALTHTRKLSRGAGLVRAKQPQDGSMNIYEQQDDIPETGTFVQTAAPLPPQQSRSVFGKLSRRSHGTPPPAPTFTPRQNSTPQQAQSPPPAVRFSGDGPSPPPAFDENTERKRSLFGSLMKSPRKPPSSSPNPSPRHSAPASTHHASPRVLLSQNSDTLSVATSKSGSRSPSPSASELTPEDAVGGHKRTRSLFGAKILAKSPRPPVAPAPEEGERQKSHSVFGIAMRRHHD